MTINSTAGHGTLEVSLELMLEIGFMGVFETYTVVSFPCTMDCIAYREVRTSSILDVNDADVHGMRRYLT